LAGLTLGLLVTGGVAAYPALPRASSAGVELSKAGRDAHSVLGEFLEGQKPARIANALDQYQARYAKALGGTRDAELAYIASQASLRGWLQLIASCVVALVVLLGHFSFGASAAVIALAVIVLARITGPLQVLLRAGQGMAYMLPAFAELKVLDADLAQDRTPSAEVLPCVRTPDLPARLQFEDVTFGYGATPILRRASFSIAEGEFVALTGPSGSGKTTIADLACGLLSPWSGNVLGDGTQLAGEDANNLWRGRIACVGQDAFLFDASLRENLAFGAASADPLAIEQALEAVAATELVARLPQGIETRIGPRGHFLSGGERQRICIARALMRDPSLLILDEATNGLDSDSEAQILAQLADMRVRMTILLIGHRPTAIEHAGRVLTLSGGTVSG